MEHNNKDENINSENIYIKGDNLEALKHMLNSYESKIKCIYIDPPYNTGSDDFVYPDNFKYDKQTLIKLGLTEEEAERVETLYGKSTHSAWLTFMLPRLTLARELLSDDGVIFISIDDNEQANLKLLCDEVFGEDNFIAQMTREAIKGGSQSKYIRITHDYVFAYAKNLNEVEFGGIEVEGIKLNLKDEKGAYAKGRELNKWGAGSRREDSPSMWFPITGPNGEDVYPIRNDGSEGRWRLGKEKMHKIVADGDVIFEKRDNGTYVVYEKIRDDSNRIKQFISILKDEYINAKGTEDIKKLFNIERSYFDYAKPVNLIQDLLKMSNSIEDDIILDFFSGSATTAHAVMQLNAEDGGNRKYILVNIPEPTKENSEAFKAGYKTICDIGIARIKKAAEKIQNDTNADIDYGFKIYELNTLSERTLNDIESFEEANSKLFANDMRTSFEFGGVSGEDTILQTWKVDDGFGFIEKHEEVSLNDCLAYKVKKVLYLINPTMNDFVKPLIEKLENELKDVNKIVVLGYSYTFVQLQSLDINIKNFNDIKGQADRVKVEVRY